MKCLKCCLFLAMILCLCLDPVFADKADKKEPKKKDGKKVEDDGSFALPAFVPDFLVPDFLADFLANVFGFMNWATAPLVRVGGAVDGLCNSVLDFIPLVGLCSCKMSPKIWPQVSAEAKVTCPVFDTCPANTGFVCLGCNVNVVAGGYLAGPAAKATLGATCQVDSPIIDFVKLEASGGVGAGVDGQGPNFGLSSCKVSASAIGFSFASCSCDVDDSCGTFGVQYECKAAGITLFSSGGCVNLDAMGI